MSLEVQSGMESHNTMMKDEASKAQLQIMGVGDGPGDCSGTRAVAADPASPKFQEETETTSLYLVSQKSN